MKCEHGDCTTGEEARYECYVEYETGPDGEGYSVNIKMCEPCAREHRRTFEYVYDLKEDRLMYKHSYCNWPGMTLGEEIDMWAE